MHQISFINTLLVDDTHTYSTVMMPCQNAHTHTHNHILVSPNSAFPIGASWGVGGGEMSTLLISIAVYIPSCRYVCAADANDDGNTTYGVTLYFDNHILPTWSSTLLFSQLFFIVVILPKLSAATYMHAVCRVLHQGSSLCHKCFGYKNDACDACIHPWVGWYYRWMGTGADIMEHDDVDVVALFLLRRLRTKRPWGLIIRLFTGLSVDDGDKIRVVNATSRLGSRKNRCMNVSEYLYGWYIQLFAWPLGKRKICCSAMIDCYSSWMAKKPLSLSKTSWQLIMLLCKTMWFEKYNGVISWGFMADILNMSQQQ